MIRRVLALPLVLGAFVLGIAAAPVMGEARDPCEFDYDDVRVAAAGQVDLHYVTIRIDDAPEQEGYRYRSVTIEGRSEGSDTWTILAEKTVPAEVLEGEYQVWATWQWADELGGARWACRVTRE